MSINLRHGIDNEQTTKKFGPTFGSIDFEPATITKEVLSSQGQKSNAGTFYIGGKSFNVTLAELDRIIETCQSAKTVFFQKFRFRV